MTYEKDPYDLENIPDFAMQPARGAEEYNNQFMPREAIERYDASVYDKILHRPANAPREEIKEVQPVIQPEIQPVIQPEIQQEGEVLEQVLEVEDTTEDEPVLEFSDPFESDAEAAPDTIPVMAPVHQPAPLPKAVPIKIVPVVGSLISSKLKLVDIKKKPQIRIFIEEDILVPDVKPDLASIISMDGKIKLSEKEIHTSQADTDTIKFTGDLMIQTVYIPDTIVDGEPMVAIESRIPFKNETEIKSGPRSDLLVIPTLESIDYTVVNERKFKVKATLALGLREYSNMDIEIFEGLRDEDIQMLKEKIQATDVALRKTETAEIKEELNLKDGMPDILKILKYDVNVVENHKQVTKEKAVINASVYCNIMYLGADPIAETSKSESEDIIYDEAIPVLYQGKTEFTQFIKLDGDIASGQNYAGSKVNFNISSLNLSAKADGNGKRNIIDLELNVDTGLELYKNIEKEVVTDVYHHLKDIQYETDEIGLMALSGSGVAEVSVREIINIPEKYGNIDKIAYISGKAVEKASYIEQGKSIVEGNIAINLICISSDDKKSAFNIKQDVPFRSAMEIPGITSQMISDNDIMLKELWFDKINNRQIEVNAGLVINTSITSQDKHLLVKNISFLENAQESHINPGIILYVSRAGDNIWKIAKKYRTTIEDIKKANDIDFSKEIRPGTKLLIVAKHH